MHFQASDVTMEVHTTILPLQAETRPGRAPRSMNCALLFLVELPLSGYLYSSGMVYNVGVSCLL